MTARPPRMARCARTVLVTMALASWSSYMLGIDDVAILTVVTFGWTATATLRLSAQERSESPAQDWHAVLPALAGGLVMWVLLPMLREAYQDWWFWRPLPMGEPFVAVAAVAAIGWPLRPFVPWASRLGSRSGGHDLDVPVLSTCLFVLSGSLVPVIAGLIAVGHGWFGADRAPEHEPVFSPPAGSHVYQDVTPLPMRT